MKNNQGIKRLTVRSFKANRGRNVVAIFAIVLTTLMFTTLFVLTQSMSQNMTEMAFRQSGYDTHISIKSITDEQMELIAAHPDIKESGRSIVVGLAENNALSGRQVEIRYADAFYAAHGFAMPTTGRLPESANEIALDDMTLNRLGIPLELGQRVTLEWRSDFTSDEVNTSEFTLCGFWEGNTSSYASMAWVSEDFALTAAENVSSEDSICGIRMTSVLLYGDENIESTMDGVLSDTGLLDLEYNVNLAYLSNIEGTALRESLPMYGGMLLVFIAGYLIIYNIFQISVIRDIQFFGKLKTLGASTKQIKRILYGQANRLSLISIPIGLLIGYLFGMVLVPIMIGSFAGKASVSASPIIFIGSVIFAWLTVLISCLRPAKIAGKVSPMEALHYGDGNQSSRKKSKKSRNGAFIFRMALANLGRNKQRTVLVVCSLTLGLVLLTSFYAKNASFDIDKFLADLTIADFEVADATSDDYINGYNPQGTTLRPVLAEQIEDFTGLEAMGRLYSQETTISLTQRAIDNTRSFYEKDGRLSYMQDDTEWMDGYQNAVDSGNVGSVVFGCDGLTWDVLGDSRNLMDGTFNPELFATGEYVMAVGIGTEDFSETMPTFSVGDTVEIDGKEYTVMGIVHPIEPLTGGVSTLAYSNDLIVPVDAFQQHWTDNTLRKLYFNVSDEQFEAAQAMLTEYQQQVDSSMPISSRQSMAEQYESQTRASAVMGNAISIVIALVGVLNFMNSMVTAIISRKREFAMIQSVGMTKRQLRQMLIFEGLNYAALTLVLSYVIGAFAVNTVVRNMVEGGFSTFQFTLLPLIICTPILLILAVVIPFVCCKNLEKQSLVERIREIG